MTELADYTALLGGTAAAALRAFVAFTIIFAGFGKLRRPLEFEGEVADYRLLPAMLVAPFSRALPFVELALGAALLAQRFVAPVSALAAGLLLLFAVAAGINLARGRRHISCGCGGASDRPISEALVISNVAIAALLLLTTSVSPPSSAVLAVGALVMGGGACILVRVFATLRAFSAPSPRVAPGKGQA